MWPGMTCHRVDGVRSLDSPLAQQIDQFPDRVLGLGDRQS